MKFFIQYDSPYRNRALKIYSKSGGYSKINLAITVLKTRESPHRLCAMDDKGCLATIMIFEGTNPKFNLSLAKIKPCIKVGKRTFVPKAIIRKTTQKRKSKRDEESKKV